MSDDLKAKIPNDDSARPDGETELPQENPDDTIEEVNSATPSADSEEPIVEPKQTTEAQPMADDSQVSKPVEGKSCDKEVVCCSDIFRTGKQSQ